VWGLDVARYGDDRTALCVRRHRKVESVESWRGLDTMQTAGRVKLAYDEAMEDDKPTLIVVDVIGVGAGVVDRLREQGLPVRALNVAEAPAVRAKFHRLRDEMYWKGREWFEAMDCECPVTEVGAELGDVTYSYTSAGQIKVESKDEIKERLGRSPDVGESLLLSLMADCEPIAEDRADRYRRARSRVAETRGRHERYDPRWNPLLPNLDVPDHTPIKTGVLDRFGKPIERQPRPIGWALSEEAAAVADAPQPAPQSEDDEALFAA
jgi:hypothetical protein